MTLHHPMVKLSRRNLARDEHDCLSPKIHTPPRPLSAGPPTTGPAVAMPENESQSQREFSEPAVLPTMLTHPTHDESDPHPCLPIPPAPASKPMPDPEAEAAANANTGSATLGASPRPRVLRRHAFPTTATASFQLRARPGELFRHEQETGEQYRARFEDLSRADQDRAVQTRSAFGYGCIMFGMLLGVALLTNFLAEGKKIKLGVGMAFAIALGALLVGIENLRTAWKAREWANGVVRVGVGVNSPGRVSSPGPGRAVVALGQARTDVVTASEFRQASANGAVQQGGPG